MHLIFKVTFATMEVIITLIKKDFLVDFRQKYLLAGIALYVFATIYISYLAFNSVIAPSHLECIVLVDSIIFLCDWHV